MKKEIIPIEILTQKIYFIRGQKVMLDKDLAEIYQVPTKRLNEQVKRNPIRFPKDFMFQLSQEEYKNLIPSETLGKNNRSQIATGSQKHRDPKFLPYAFTEHGVSMLSSVLNSPRAIQMNIYIIRTFIKLREVFLQDQDFEIRILDMEAIQKLHGKDIDEILEHLRYLTRRTLKPPGPIGFQP